MRVGLAEMEEKISTQEKEIQEMKKRLKKNVADYNICMSVIDGLNRKTADLKLANEHLKDDNDYLEKENEHHRIRIGKLEKESNVLKRKSSEIREPYENCIFCCGDFTESEYFVCPANDYLRVACDQCHLFHAECLEKCQSSGHEKCPYCSTPYTKIAKFPNPFKVNKQEPRAFAEMFEGLCGKNGLISRNKAISAISPFVISTKNRDYRNVFDNIIPPKTQFKLSEFQEFTVILAQNFIQDDYYLAFDTKNFFELQNPMYFFQKEMEKEIQSSEKK